MTVYVSDHPVLHSKHVLAEAAKAYRNGLRYHAALAGVTSAPAELLGLGQRVGKVKAGFDADVVVWDSDPLSLGASPVQVFIDGTPQLKDVADSTKPLTSPMEILYESKIPEKRTDIDDLVITGISNILLPGFEHLSKNGAALTIAISGGSIVCTGECTSELATAVNVMHLDDGHIAPALTAFGSLLGLEEIAAEDDTSDGENDQSSFSAAIDGLMLEGKNLDAAYSHGVTRAISAPKFGGDGHKGISVGFRLGASHALERDAVFDPDVALHYTMTLAAKQGKSPSISSAIAELKAKLLKTVQRKKKAEESSVEDEYLENVINGTTPLVIDVHSADTIASLLRLKEQIDESLSNSTIRLVLLGGAESHLLAKELAEASVGVILAPLYPYGASWDQRRSLPGLPLSNGTAIDVLHAAGVNVAIGVNEDWEARDLYLQAGTVKANGGGRISDAEAVAFASTKIYDILGLQQSKEAHLSNFVVFEGYPLTTNGQRRAVANGRGKVSMWT